MSEELTKNLPRDDLSRILALLSSMNERLIALEDKVDRRLQETRPIWEQVLSRMEAFETRMEAFETRMGAFEARMGAFETRMETFEARLDSFEARLENLETEMRSGFRKLERQIGLLAEDVITVRADQRDLERRMDKLESETAR